MLALRRSSRRGYSRAPTSTGLLTLCSKARLAVVSSPALEFDPYLNDPDRWGVSLAQMAEIMLPCLDAAGVRSIAEVGAYAGDLTRVLVAWGGGGGARGGGRSTRLHSS